MPGETGVNVLGSSAGINVGSEVLGTPSAANGSIEPNSGSLDA